MLTIDPSLGCHINETIKEAKELAEKYDELVLFKFNDILVYIDKTSNLDLVYRDYLNAHHLEWMHIGPEYVDEYDEETKTKLDKAKAEQENRERESKLAYEIEQANKTKELKNAINSTSIELVKEDQYNEWKDKNTDPYGKGIFEYAEYWAELMQATAKDNGVEIDMNFIINNAKELSFKADIGGITGYMYGAAVSILSTHWKYGEYLRKWHNNEYGHDGDGVVNPAVLTIGTKS
jgi:hypothetical protein